MKKHLLSIAIGCTVLSTLGVSNAQSLGDIFYDDFSTGSVLAKGNPYLGGYYQNQSSFNQWVGTEGNIDIANGTLNTASSSNIRSAGIVLDPSLFGGVAGEYVLSFDITSYDDSGNAGNVIVAGVWAGSGYDLSNVTGDSLIVDTFNAELTAQGAATSSQLASDTYTNVGNNNTLTFTYDGTSAVAIFLGVNTPSYPFPAASFDNVAISTMAVPEPSAMALLGLALSGLLLVRRRVI